MLDMIIEIGGGLLGLAVLAFFGLMPILTIASIWVESLQAPLEVATEYFLYAALIALGAVVLFCVLMPLWVLLYIPLKILQAFSALFVQFVSDEEYEEYQKMEQEIRQKINAKYTKAQESRNAKSSR